MVYIVTLTLSLLCSFFKSKWQWILSLPLLVVLIFLMANVSPEHSYDTASYEYMYDLTVESKRFESGYLQMSSYFYNHNFSYNDFRLFYFGIFMFILWIAAIRFKTNVLTFFTIFSVFPFFMEITQVRNFAMISLILLGLSFIKNKGKVNFLLGLTFIYVGSLFQVSGLLFLVIPLLIPLREKIKFKHGLVMYLVCVLGMLFVQYVLPRNIRIQFISKIFSTVVDRSNVIDAANLYSQGASLTVVLGYIFSALVGWCIWGMMIKKHPDIVRKRYFFVLFAGMFIANIAVVFLAASSDYERFIRNALLFLILALSIYEKKYVFTLRDIIKFWGMVGVMLMIVTSIWRYWDTSEFGRWQFIPYLMQWVQ